MAGRWRKITQATQDPPGQLDLEEDECYFAREYITEGYRASQTNSLVLNFKKSPDRRNRPEWRHKVESIKKFSFELHFLFQNVNLNNVLFTWIPPSKIKTDPKYDDRNEQLFSHFKRNYYSSSNCIELFTFNTSFKSSHTGGTRNQIKIKQNTQLSPFEIGTYKYIVIIDDVITTGSHFKACKELIIDRDPSVNVIGVFWAKTIWQ